MLNAFCDLSNLLDVRYNSLYHTSTKPKGILGELNTYRLENKLSQTELAEKLGVAFQTVNRWFNRHMKPGQIQEYQIKKLLMKKIRE